MFLCPPLISRHVPSTNTFQLIYWISIPDGRSSYPLDKKRNHPNNRQDCQRFQKGTQDRFDDCLFILFLRLRDARRVRQIGGSRNYCQKSFQDHPTTKKKYRAKELTRTAGFNKHHFSLRFHSQPEKFNFPLLQRN